LGGSGRVERFHLCSLADEIGFVFGKHDYGGLNTKGFGELFRPFFTDIDVAISKQADILSVDARFFGQLFLCPSFQVAKHSNHLAGRWRCVLCRWSQVIVCFSTD